MQKKAINVATKKGKRDFLKKYITYIDAIRHNGGISDKTSLKNATGVAWPTLENAISDAFNIKGSPIILENNQFTLNTNFSIHVGISIGATQIKLFLCDFGYNSIVNNHYFSERIANYLDELKVDALHNSPNSNYMFFCYNREDSRERLVSRLGKILKIILKIDSELSNVLSVNISFPGIILDPELRIDFSPNIKCLRNINIKNLISTEISNSYEVHDIKIHFEHDTQSASIYEKEFLYRNKSEISKSKNICCVYIAAGIGSSLIINNQLFRGTSNSFGELGHTSAPDLLIESLADNDLSRKEILDKYYYYYYKDEQYIGFESFDEQKFNDLINNLKQQPKRDLLPCECGKLSCLENTFRRKVFDAYNIEEYLERINDSDELYNFPEKHPYRYRLLKEYLSHIVGLIINMLNPDLIVFSGRIMRDIPKIENELNTITNNAIGIPASKCKITLGSKDIFSAAAGTAISSLHCCIQDKDFCDMKW